MNTITDFKFIVEAQNEVIHLIMKGWSGFTTPSKYNILILTKKEASLNSGRFEYYKQELYVDEKQKLLFPIFKDQQHINSVFDWIGENIKHPWSIILKYQEKSSILYLINMFTFVFQEPSDAILFKLKWT